MTQYVYLNYVASFECATNLTGYNVTFVYGPNITIDQVTETNLPNGAKKITFPATNEVNGSDIYCVARSESVVTTSTAAYIYIQGNLFAIMNAANDDLYACIGPPESVSNLQGHQLDYCCVFISWDPPFVLPGLTVQYRISVGTNNRQELISNTNYTYCPLNLTNGYYRFIVMTANGAGNGLTTNNVTLYYHSSTTYSVFVF